MAVLPGVPSTRPTPGGMPDSRQNRPGPAPSMPKMGAGPADFGANAKVAGVPDPGQLEELFTSYTSGQITREDLVSQLGSLGEGQGGILGLLEEMDPNTEGSRTGMADQAVDVVDSQGGAEHATQPVMPGGVMPGVGLEVGGAGPRGGQGMGQATDLGTIPPLTEPLDARHQRISVLLQGYGLQPDDADQMSTLLNPHADWHGAPKTGQTAAGKMVWSEDEQLWTEEGGQEVAYDPTTLTGTKATEARLQAGLGKERGDVAGGFVGGQFYGDVAEVDKLGDAKAIEMRRQSLAAGPQIQETTWANRQAEIRAAEFDVAGDYSAPSRLRTVVNPDGTTSYFIGNKEIVKDPPATRISERDEKLDLPTKAIPGPQAPGVLASPLPFDPTTSPGEEGQVETHAGVEWRYSEGRWQRAEAPGELEDVWKTTRTPFHNMFGGFYNPKDYEWKGFGGQEKDPYMDEETGKLFPNKKAYDQYIDWIGKDENQVYGSNEPPEFSHWVYPGTNTPIPTWKLDPNLKSASKYTGKKEAVIKDARRVTITPVDKAGNPGKPIVFNMPTYGLTATEIGRMEHLMVNEKYIPWGPQKGFLPGYGPEGHIEHTRIPPGTKIPNPDKPTYFNKGDELPDGWSFKNEDHYGETYEVLRDAEGVVVQGPPDYTGGTDMPTSAMADFGDGRGQVNVWDRDEEGDWAGTDMASSINEITSAMGGAGLDGTPGTEMNFPHLTEFLRLLPQTAGVAEAANLDPDLFSRELLNVIGDIEGLRQKGQNEAANRAAQLVQQQADRDAAKTRADLDRAFQENAAIGTINNTATLAARAEDAKQKLQQYQMTGYVEGQTKRVWDEQVGAYVQEPGAPQTTVERERMQQEGALKGRELTLSEEQIAQNRDLKLTEMFGQLIGGTTEEGGVASTQQAMQEMRTVEQKKFGLSQTLARAEATGIWMDEGTATGQEAIIGAISGAPIRDQDWLNRFYIEGEPIHPNWLKTNLTEQGKIISANLDKQISAGQVGGTPTLSAQRLAFERDVANQKNNWENRRLDNEARAIETQRDTQIQQMNLTSAIEGGRLQEAVAARQQKNLLDAAALQHQRDKFKVDTLIALSEPATFLFAQRLGLFDSLGDALGVDFSDEIYPGEIPQLSSGSIPTMQELRAASPTERDIMLAEMAVSGGFSVEEALRQVQQGIPGGRAPRRQAITGRAR